MLDVEHSEIELIVMNLRLAAVFGTAIGEDAKHGNSELVEERDYAVVEQVNRRNRCFGRVKPADSDLRVSVNEGLLIVAAYTLQCTDVEGVLRTKVARMSGFDFANGNFVVLFLF